MLTVVVFARHPVRSCAGSQQLSHPNLISLVDVLYNTGKQAASLFLPALSRFGGKGGIMARLKDSSIKAAYPEKFKEAALIEDLKAKEETAGGRTLATLLANPEAIAKGVEAVSMETAMAMNVGRFVSKRKSRAPRRMAEGSTAANSALLEVRPACVVAHLPSATSSRLVRVLVFWVCRPWPSHGTSVECSLTSTPA